MTKQELSEPAVLNVSLHCLRKKMNPFEFVWIVVFVFVWVFFKQNSDERLKKHL